MTTTTKPLYPSNSAVDQAAQAADHGIRSTQQLADEALDSLAGTVQDVRQKATPILNQTTEQVSALAQRGMDTVRDTAQQLREKATRASDSTVSYIKEEPVKALLIAAATGAALMALVSLTSRLRDRS